MGEKFLCRSQWFEKMSLKKKPLFGSRKKKAEAKLEEEASKGSVAEKNAESPAPELEVATGGVEKKVEGVTQVTPREGRSPSKPVVGVERGSGRFSNSPKAGAPC